MTLIWCPDHLGIRGNEIADEKANEAVKSDQAPPLPMYGSPTKAKKQVMNGFLTSSLRLKHNIPALGIQASAILSQLDLGCCSLKRIPLPNKESSRPLQSKM